MRNHNQGHEDKSITMMTIIQQNKLQVQPENFLEQKLLLNILKVLASSKQGPKKQIIIYLTLFIQDVQLLVSVILIHLSVLIYLVGLIFVVALPDKHMNIITVTLLQRQ